MRYDISHLFSPLPSPLPPSLPLPALLLLTVSRSYHRTLHPWQTEPGEGLPLPQGQVLGSGQHRREGLPQNQSSRMMSIISYRGRVCLELLL